MARIQNILKTHVLSQFLFKASSIGRFKERRHGEGGGDRYQIAHISPRSALLKLPSVMPLGNAKTRYQASASRMRSALFSVVTLLRLVDVYRGFGKAYRSYLQGTDCFNICLNQIQSPWKWRQHVSPKRRMKHHKQCDNSEGHYLNNMRLESLKPDYCFLCCYIIHTKSVTGEIAGNCWFRTYGPWNPGRFRFFRKHLSSSVILCCYNHNVQNANPLTAVWTV